MTTTTINHESQAAPYFKQGVDGGLGVLMIHGLTATPTEVLPIANYLAECAPELSLSCPLLPGHGTTPQQLRDTTARDWVAAAASEVGRLAECCSELAVVGVSMGAVIGAHLAIVDPRIRSLTMLAPAFSTRRLLAIMLPVLQPFVGYKKKSRRSLDNHRQKGLCSYDRYPLASLMEMRRLARRTSWRLPEIQIPTLIAGGRKDKYVPWSAIEKLRHRIGGDQVEVFDCPESGHVLPHEPDAPKLLEAIRDFLGCAHGA